VHNPSDHHMKEWPVYFCSAKNFLAERNCPHDVGHPDPDSVAYFARIGKEYLSVHGCDGCCRPEISAPKGN